MMSCITSCTKSEEMVDPNAMGGMTLRLVSNTLTRAEGTNDDQNYEDDITKVDFYFFAGDGSAAAVCHMSPEITGGADGNATIEKLELTSAQMGSLFANGGTSATIYVVANAPANLLPTSGTLPSLAELKAITSVLGAWKTSAGSSAQTSFLMDGKATFAKSTKELNIGLTRAAAKIDLEISSIEDEVEIEGAGGVTETWKPVIGANYPVTVTFANALRSTRIDGTFVGTNAQNTYDDSQAGYGFTSATSTNDKGETITSYTQDNPFYSYASDWNTQGANEPYLLLTVYWQKNNDAPEATYYQIPVGSIADKQIKRNNHYKVKINVGTVGSQEESKPLTLTADYTVIDWSTGDITANIKEASYLVVDENEVVMNNITSYSVGYQSSHDVTAYIVRFKYTYYNSSQDKDVTVTTEYDVTDKKTSINDVASGLTDLTFEVSKEGDKNGVITLTHVLDNEMSDKVYHYFPYEITVQVTHPTLPDQEIVFKQYPAMYVESETQTGTSVIINNKTDVKDSNWQYVHGSAVSGKQIYKITISAFDATTNDYIICDPRQPANNNRFTLHNIHAESDDSASSSNEITNGDYVNDDELTGYRAAIEGEESDYLVSPSFIMASSFGAYGKAYNMYPLTSAKYRCAAYQEAGYPAGRWRLPTPAELQFVLKLCIEGKLDNVFYNNYIYASSNGSYQYNSRNNSITYTTDTANSVRCVYDIWYWKDKLADEHKSKFIWAADGDMEENIGNKQQYFTTDVEFK